MKLGITASIGYKDVFDDYTDVNIGELLKNIPTKNSLEIVGHFLAQLHTNEKNASLQWIFLKMWLIRLPNTIYQRVQNFVEKKLESSSMFNFINNVSGLILIENIIENSNELNLATALTIEQELNLFKAYLYCSQLWIDKQEQGYKLPDEEQDDDIIKILLPTQVQFQELLEFKDFRLQFIKAIYFFRFCESNPQFKIYLEIFLSEYKLESWHNYLMNLLTLYVRKFEPLETPSVINVPNDFPDILNFLEELSIEPKTFKKSDDFLSIREKPVYRIDRNNYIFLNLNFLIDKLYQGIQFDFARVLVNNSATYKGRVIKSRVNFLSIFGEEFSETVLFYNVMDYAFEKSGYLKFKGKDMKLALGDGEPDYCIRDKAKVYLFEFKNIFLSAEIKHSVNYDIIMAEIFKKLVLNEFGKPKGVTQLANVIEKIRASEFEKIDEYDYDTAIIYPIIVYTDFSFNLPGINYILNKEFRKQLADRKLKNTSNVKDLVLIDLDSFIKFQDLFRNKTLKLNNCFNEYYDYVTAKRAIFNHISTFNMFIHEKTKKIHYDTPRMFLDEILKMIPNDENYLKALDRLSSK